MAFSNYVPPLLSDSQAGAMPDIIGQLLSGYGGVYQAKMLPQELMKKQLENKWYEPNIKSQIGLRGAQAGHLGSLTEGQNITNQYLPKTLQNEQAAAEFKAKNPLLSMPGNAGQVGALLYLQQHPELAQNQGEGQQGNNIADLVRQSIINSIEAKKANPSLEAHRELQDKALLWKSLPANAKAHAIAIGQGAGFSGDETAKWLSEGKSMKDLLFQHGITDESEVDPVYQLTTSAQSQLLQRQFAAKEADYLSNFIRKSTGEYARTVAGYSPKLIKEQLAGKNEEQQAKLLAARGLAQELVNLRLVLAGAKSTVAAQNQLRDKSMLDLKNFRSLVPPKVWGRMQEIMDSELQKMFKKAQTGYGNKVSKALTKKNNENDPLGIR